MKKPAKTANKSNDVNNSSIPIFNNSSINPLNSVATSGSVSTSFGGALAPTIQHQQGSIARRALGDITNTQTSSTNASSELSRKRKAEPHNEDVEKSSDGKAKPRIRIKITRPLQAGEVEKSSNGKAKPRIRIKLSRPLKQLLDQLSSPDVRSIPYNPSWSSVPYNPSWSSVHSHFVACTGLALTGQLDAATMSWFKENGLTYNFSESSVPSPFTTSSSTLPSLCASSVLGSSVTHNLFGFNGSSIVLHPDIAENQKRLSGEHQSQLHSLMSTFYNNPTFCPYRRDGDDTAWVDKHDIDPADLDEGRKIATAKLQEIKNKHPAFSTVADYWIAIINVAVPGDRLYFFLLHCALNWFKGHITFNCGGNCALGSPKDLKKSSNCTLTALRPLSKYVKDYCRPSLVMGHDADAVGGINVNQFCCPCCGPGFERCPNIDAIKNRTDVLISILSIGFNFCTEFKIAAFMNSLGGMTTNVNVVIDGLQHCNSDFVTICAAKVPHWQFSRVPFSPLQGERAGGPSVYLRTSRRISSQIDEVSICLENHLRKIGGPIPDRSLKQHACNDPDLPLVREKPTIEMFENLVRVRESRKEQIVNYIVSHMGDHRDQLVLGLEGVPDYIINYAQKHILELQAEFSIASIEEVTIGMLHQVMTAHAVEQKRRERIYVIGDSIPKAFRNSSVKEVVCNLSRIPEIVDVANYEIASMRLGGNWRTCTFSVRVSSYRNRRSVADNPGKDLIVLIRWKDGADTTKKDEIRDLMSAILAAGLDHEVFKNLPWCEIKAYLLTVFGVDPEFEYLLQEAIKGKSGVNDIVAAIKDMRHIRELAAEIDGMRLGGNTSNSTFCLGVTKYRNRRSVADNPDSSLMRVQIQWKDGADTTKKDEIRDLMSAILAAGLDHEVFKNLPWCEIKAYLLTVFGVDPEFEYLLQEAIKGKSGVNDIVAAIKDMRHIRELAAKIAGMRLGGNWRTCTFSVYVSSYRNRRSVADNPGSDLLRVAIQWRDDADDIENMSGMIRGAMKNILDVWIKAPDFQNLHWGQITGHLKNIFV